MCEMYTECATTCQKKVNICKWFKEALYEWTSSYGRANCHQCQMNVCAGDITPGDGNCFYNALLQQIHRFETLESLIPMTPIPNHL